jgi:Uma2 family endonuclease
MGPTPQDRHQQISSVICFEIGTYFKRRDCQLRSAPYDVRLLDSRKSTEDAQIFTVVQPDICVICDAEKIDRRGCIGAPDWVIEILSPGNSKTEMQVKYELYQENGVKEYWIVQSEHESILQFALKDDQFTLVKMCSGDDVIAPVLFPELTIRLDEIF